jgi:hypothetical protein
MERKIGKGKNIIQRKEGTIEKCKKRKERGVRMKGCHNEISRKLH